MHIFEKNILLLLLLAILGLLFFACNQDHSDYHQLDSYQQVENVFDFGQESNKQVYSGKSAILLDGNYPYGMSGTINNLQRGDEYDISVKRWVGDYGQAFLVVQCGELIYEKVGEGKVMEDNKEWEILSIKIKIPFDANKKDLKVYVWNPYQEPVYFDDLRIDIKKGKSNNENIVLSDKEKESINELHLNVPESSFDKIKQVRKEALKVGLLFSQDDHWVKAWIKEKQDSIPLKMRLKGDWTDHLSGKQWSYRIKTKKGYTWNRMRTFSIQHPKTRSYLHEWLYHQMLSQEDVLTPRYQFVKVFINNEESGIYALEEHFDKQLIEYNKRREGPIVKFSEDGFWEVMNRWKGDAPYYEASQVDVFKENRTMESDVLRQQYENARTLMEQYKEGTTNFSNIFDQDLMAKFLAITDVHEAYHSTRWHNQRFYYNPVSAVLEPIGFDGYGEVKHPIGKAFLGFKHYDETKQVKGEEYLLHPFFNDTMLFKKYIEYLLDFTTEEYIENFIQNNEKDLRKYYAMVENGKNPPEHIKSIRKRAKELRNLIQPYEHNSIIANLVQATESKTTLQLQNYHCLPIEIIGIGKTETQADALFAKPVLLYPNQKKKSTQLTLKGVGDFLFCKALGTEEAFTIKISKLTQAQGIHPRQSLLSQNNLDSFPFIHVKGNEVFIKSGNYKITQPIIIPANKKVYFAPNTKMDFINGSFFLSYSTIEMNGGDESPIIIKSSDNTGQGFTVLQSDERSSLNYVVFDGLNTLNYKGWALTGAVNFYEADVSFTNCSFINNQCEDALNTIRSDFTLNQSLINQTLSDGFDADFCTGQIHNSRFTNTGNDGLDFSGSSIKLHNCNIENTGDKGISVGEESILNIFSCSIIDAATGVAAKDLSTVTIDSIYLKDIGKGFTAFQKKAEYGGATISIKSYETNNVVLLKEVEEGSNIKGL